MNELEHINNKLSEQLNLTCHEASRLASNILNQDLSQEMILDSLSMLADKGETVDEILGFIATVLNDCEYSLALHDFSSYNLLDMVGTGGSGLEKFNVSTAATFIIAACGIKSAKHGNKGSKKNNGSFDLLEALEIPINFSPQQAKIILQKMGCVFLYTRNCHPKIGKLAEIRRQLGKPSIFNKIGPFCNPAPITHQVIGIPNHSQLIFFSMIAKKLERKRCLLISGEPGIDEISISGRTWITELNEQHEKGYCLLPIDFNLKPVDYVRMPVGDANHNAALFLELINGKAPAVLQAMVALNAGAGFYACNHVASIYAGYQLAMDVINSGKLKNYFYAYREFSHTISDLV